MYDEREPRERGSLFFGSSAESMGEFVVVVVVVVVVEKTYRIHLTSHNELRRFAMIVKAP